MIKLLKLNSYLFFNKSTSVITINLNVDFITKGIDYIQKFF